MFIWKYSSISHSDQAFHFVFHMLLFKVWENNIQSLQKIWGNKGKVQRRKNVISKTQNQHFAIFASKLFLCLNRYVSFRYLKLHCVCVYATVFSHLILFHEFSHDFTISSAIFSITRLNCFDHFLSLQTSRYFPPSFWPL